MPTVRAAHASILSMLTLVFHANACAELPDNPIFPSDARLELVFERTAKLNSGLTEGPSVSPDGSIYFTDLPFGPTDQTMIHRYDPKSGRTTLFTAAARKSSGLAFDEAGQLLACDGADGGGRCILRWDVKNENPTVVADRYQGHRLNAPNDLCVDRSNRIYFTDPRYLGSEPIELDHRAVYRVESDGSVIEITHDVEMPNGIALSCSGKTLYVGDHNNGGSAASPSDPPPKRGVMRLYAFSLDSDGLINGPKRTLIDFGAENGCDGITVDAAENIYVSCRSLAKPGVMVVDQQGKQLAYLPTGPENQTGKFDDLHGIPSNVEFGAGDDAQTLYVTIDKGLYRIRTKQNGCSPVWSTRSSEARK